MWAHGYTPATELDARPLAGLSPRTALAALTGPDDVDGLLATYRIAYRLAAGAIDLVAGVSQLLEGLRAADVASALVTNQHLSEVEPLLDGLGLGRHMAIVITSDDLAARADRKPAASMAHWACRALTVDPADVLVIGDTVPDIEMAHAAALDSVAVAWGPHAPVELADADPTWLVADTDELAELLAGWLDQRIHPRQRLGPRPFDVRPGSPA
jgi:phosphoglycolate phosphatase